MEYLDNNKWILILLLFLILVIGSMLRIYDLGERTMSHVEMYVPGIELPKNLSVPPIRNNLTQIIRQTFNVENYPPAYYILMLGWAKLLGTDVLVLRAPSLIFGILCVLLIYFLCKIEENELVGLFAAGMLALNGLHIYWSQIAKMCGMACFLGLLSTLLLVFVTKRNNGNRIYQFFYLAVTFSGLATSHYFWPIFATQIVWVFISNWSNIKSKLALLRSQIFIFILGCPLLAIGAYQSKRPSYVEDITLTSLLEYLQFGFLLEPDPISTPIYSIPSYAMIGVSLICAVLFIQGLASKEGTSITNNIEFNLSPFVFGITGTVISFVILTVAFYLHFKNPIRTKLIIATALVPLVLIIIDFIICNYWSNLQNSWLIKINKYSFFNRISSLNTLLSIVPVTLITITSLYEPIFISRGILLYTPFLIIVVARGIVSVARSRLAWAPLLIFLLAIHILSAIDFNLRPHAVRDYKNLYAKWSSKILESDLILVHKHYAITPIFYYLKPDQYRLVGSNYAEEINNNPTSRIWVLQGFEIPTIKSIDDALHEYTVMEKVEAFNIWATLYERE